MTALDGAVELLDRSLAYTRVALAGVRDERLSAPTPCAGWDLARLLQHMEDSLDAFGEGARGRVGLAGTGPRTVPSAVRVGSLQQKACALLGAWSHPPARVRVGPYVVDTGLVAEVAALEIAVHGWDVAQALDLEHPLPEALSRRLLPVAEGLVTDADRGRRFAPARPVGVASDTARLLGFLGRDLTGPHGQINGNRSTGPQIAS
ncbi:hypothetical protein NSZ01_30590 [Nocardioides szechwanensis]|uniref:TIGR03086 family protein n=1 Tax=Nocardioides szechwanensis TaxID=1005944 RepID=A0A1H0DZC5_9ACTN|nr:TIGR03086 family metal-binding protein [Nocardioides szechwanensis]GEP35291.1 hypothetical protein NSZ01_30590 [Nocardioides szechwanensis]SDN75607.1 TIGR03086 family protein [Nocardioides szechwanensis]